MSAQQPSAAGPGGSAAGGCDEATVLLGLNQAPSMNSVLRALKREESSLFSCVASIADDAQFVEQVSARYPGRPLLPNLRCGVWYVRPPLGATCYFKSTDGHNNNWSFSTVRLNLSTAEAAAAAGGCVIVDATRRGKRFPDAMSKTIPMWCAVLNRAVHRLRQQAAAPAAASHAAAAGAAGAVPRAAPWDIELHLPPWVSDVEHNSIQQRLDGWVEDLLGVKPDLSVLVGALAKPLRCLWVSQDTHLWAEEGQAVDVASLPFTPVVLVNASASATRERRCLMLPAEAPGEEPLSISYSYCPGAADDEESWACGLSPELMWRHLRALLAAGPGGIEAAVRRLLAQQQQQLGQLPAAAAQGAAGAAPRTTAAVAAGPAVLGSTKHDDAAAAQTAAPASAVAAAALADGPRTQPSGVAGLAENEALASVPVGAAGLPAALQQLGAGQHCLLPRGCLPAQSAAVQQLGSGIFLLGGTSLALSSAAAAAAPAVWQHVDAVMHLGVQPVAGMEQERQWCPRQAAAAAPAGPQRAAPEEAASNGCSPGSAACSSEPHSLCPHRSAQLPAADPAVHVDPAACRYCWLRVRGSKNDRHSLQQHLPAALAFARAQLAARRRLLLCCDSGLDASVCAAVACLLAFYSLEERPGAGFGLLPVWAGPPRSSSAADSAGSPATPQAGGHSGERGTCAAAGSEQPSHSEPLPRFPPVAAGFDKLAVRQHLGVVSAHYPAGRPTRGMLKQVYNFFLGQM